MLIHYTSAPENYDGFGTKTIRILGKDRKGDTIRQVEIKNEHFMWQDTRYVSGLYLSTKDLDTAESFLKAD